TEGSGKIEPVRPKRLDLIGDSPKTSQISIGGPVRGQDDNWGKAAFKNSSIGIERSQPADNDSQIVLRQTIFEAQSSVLFRSRPEADRHKIHCPGAGHHGIGARPKFKQELLIIPASERLEFAGCGSELAVGSSGDVQINKRDRTHTQ